MKWYKVFSSEEQIRQAFSNCQSILVVIKGVEICLSKYNNDYFASINQCPHNKEKLHKGWINGYGEIICPWHNYRFALNGGRECQERTPDLKMYTVKRKNEQLFIQC